jgi:hypothetical protein
VTPSQVETAARNRYNAASDNFYSQSEVFELIYQAESVLALETDCIEGVDSSTSTVIGTQGYAFPTGFTTVTRVEWNGRRLVKIDMKEDDALTALAANTTVTGDPVYYFVWNKTIYLREIPGSVQVLKIFGYKEPTALTTSPLSSTLSVPSWHHTKLVNFVTAHIAGKDKDFEGYQTYMDRWDQDVERARVFEKRRKRGDRMAYVKSEEELGQTGFDR